VWWFNSPEAAPSIAAARTGVQLESGVVRGRSVGNNQLLLALDSGAVQLVNLLTLPHDLKVGHFMVMLPWFNIHISDLM
jgi:hypothetical protein